MYDAILKWQSLGGQVDSGWNSETAVMNRHVLAYDSEAGARPWSMRAAERTL